MKTIWMPNGNNVTITLYDDQNKIFFVDTLSVLQDEKRTKFYDRVIKRFPGIDKFELEGDVEKIAFDFAKTLAARAADLKSDSKSLNLEPPEPWPEQVDGCDLLEAIAQVFGRFMILPEHAAVVFALWAVYAHVFNQFNASPMLVIASPTKRCGKTRALGLLAELCPKALSTSNITQAALFRSIERWTPTLLIDEAETLFANRAATTTETLRGILNAGHDKTASYVLRCVGEKSIDVESFSVWCPKVLALIGRLPDTLEDRSVVVWLHRKGGRETVDALRIHRERPAFQELCRKAARWASDIAEALKEADLDLPRLGSDRAVDNWLPLVAIADKAGGKWPGLARNAAVALSRPKGDNDSAIEILLGDLQKLFSEKNSDRLASVGICEALAEIEDHPWGEWRGGKPITPNGLARLLKNFEVRPKTIKLSDGVTAKGYHFADFADCFSRYPAVLTHPTVTADTMPETKENFDSPTVTSKGVFLPTVTTQQVEKQGDLLKGYGVTVGNQEIGKKKIFVTDKTTGGSPNFVEI